MAIESSLRTAVEHVLRTDLSHAGCGALDRIGAIQTAPPIGIARMRHSEIAAGDCHCFEPEHSG
jgi:hypothetical protein